MADHKTSQAYIEKQIAKYEKKIDSDVGLSASETAAYVKLLSLKGWDREYAEPGQFNPPPIDGDDTPDNDRVIKFR